MLNCMLVCLQGYGLPPKITEDPEVDLICGPDAPEKPNQKVIIDVAKERLLSLEHNIERRYLKPPFTKAWVIHLSASQPHLPQAGYATKWFIFQSKAESSHHGLQYSAS